MSNLKLIVNYKYIMLIVLFTALGVSEIVAKEVVFSSERVEIAMERARKEGKLVFLDFSAKWCTPCKWMEETTFKNNDVVEKLSKDYIAVKVDIDEDEGPAVKEAYSINYLPTLLILNSKGQLVEKIEKTMTAKDLMNVLHQHDAPENKRIITYQTNTSPSKVISRKSKDDGYTISQKDYLNYQEVEETRDYKLQLGAFTSFAAAQQRKEHLQSLFMEPISIIKDNRFEHDMFKVIMGKFITLDEAKSFQNILRRDYKLDSIIK